MKISVYLAKDKSRLPGARDAKAPMAEVKGVPARVTTYAGAERSHGAEAVVILDRGRILSVVARAGEMKLYLSARAQFRVIEPEPPTERPLDVCAPCFDGCHTSCEANGQEDRELYCRCSHSSHVQPLLAGGAR